MNHNPETCNDCKTKEKKTLSEFDKIMNLYGTIEDFGKRGKLKW